MGMGILLIHSTYMGMGMGILLIHSTYMGMGMGMRIGLSNVLTHSRIETYVPVPSHSYPWSWAGITAHNITILQQIQHIYTEHTLMASRMLTRLLRTVEVSLLKRTISCTSTVFILWRGTHSRACVHTYTI